MNIKKTLLCISLSQLFTLHASYADVLSSAISEGKVNGDIRLRYENVSEDNDAIDDASALTVRTRLAYTTNEINGFLAKIEFEDVRTVAGIDEYTVGPTGFNPNEYAVIADPEVTELDQAFLQFKNGAFTANAGRQVLTFDDHRFVGHVGWRQDRQTFDALKLNHKPGKHIDLSYVYINQRNRIFAEAADINSKDHLLNLSYKTSLGKLVGYAYLLELDNDTDNALDTYGVSFKGKQKQFSYGLEVASQTADNPTSEYDANYLMGEVGLHLNSMNFGLRYEHLGSDDGVYGFATPLATLHKFNGWADQFLGTPAEGLEDIMFHVSGKLGTGKWRVAYHQFSSDEDKLDSGSGASYSDIGNELDLSYTMKYGKHYSTGIKAAFFDADDAIFGKNDTDKIWLWWSAQF